MTLADFFSASYAWADANAFFIMAVAVLLPLVGTALAWLGKGGRTDSDGKFIASAVMGAALVGVLVEVGAIFVARSVLGASLLSANLLLLLAPAVCLAGSVLGIRLVFPLSQLGSVKTATDLGLFLLACGGVLWVMSKFRGWSVLFFGSFLQLVVIGALALFVLWRLYRRAFGLSGSRPADAAAADPVDELRAGRPGTALATSAPGNPMVAGSLAVGVVALAAGALFGLWQLTRATAPSPSPTPVRSAPVPVVVQPPADAPRPTGDQPSAYGYLDDDGVQHYVQRLDQVPPRYRAQAKPVD
ncbi:MAG TPA: hypothetical protein VGK67_05295 [Myxococcales bacterium]|jgi:hypothetical protein